MAAFSLLSAGGFCFTAGSAAAPAFFASDLQGANQYNQNPSQGVQLLGPIWCESPACHQQHGNEEILCTWQASAPATAAMG